MPPRKGKVNAWKYAPDVADAIIFTSKADFNFKPKKIEVRFKGATPLGVAILHTDKGTYAIRFNSEYISEEDIKEQFYKEPPGNISDSFPGGILSVFQMLESVSGKKQLDEYYKVNKNELRRLRKEFNDYTLDIIL